ncbi:MAG: hypothetical protein RR214_02835, partial [Synergistaceae bacterium]
QKRKIALGGTKVAAGGKEPELGVGGIPIVGISAENHVRNGAAVRVRGKLEKNRFDMVAELRSGNNHGQ